MIRIAICDDEEQELEKTEKYVTQYFMGKNDVCAEIKTFHSPDALLESEKKEAFNIFFLDIMMTPMAGMEIARVIRHLDPEAKIVFTTTSTDFAVEAFELKANHYLVKPYTKAEAFEALNRVVEAPKEELALVMKTSNGVKKMLINNIGFSESGGHYQYIHMMDGEIVKVRLKTNELWDDLGKYSQFIRPHGGYIVNMDHVQTITSYGIRILETDVPISKNSLNKIRHKYLEYSFNKES